MSREIVFMYSGQGSQYFRMGADLFANEPLFRAAVEDCEQVARGTLKQSIIAAVYAPARPDAPFDDLITSHLALFTMQYALTQVVRSWGVTPSCALGYSIGELIAYTAAGGVSLDVGLQLAFQQAELILKESPEAGMLAILGAPSLLTELQSWYSELWPGAYNLEHHFVVVGKRPILSQVQARLWDMDVSSQLLPVRRGFHSGLIQHLEVPFRRLSAASRWGDPSWPIISSMATHNLVPGDEHWWRVAREAVRFRETFDAVSRSRRPQLYLDVGPSGTLAGFARHLLPEGSTSQALSLLARSGRDMDRLRSARAAVERWMGE